MARQEIPFVEEWKKIREGKLFLGERKAVRDFDSVPIILKIGESVVLRPSLYETLVRKRHIDDLEGVSRVVDFDRSIIIKSIDELREYDESFGKTVILKGVQRVGLDVSFLTPERGGVTFLALIRSDDFLTRMKYISQKETFGYRKHRNSEVWTSTGLKYEEVEEGFEKGSAMIIIKNGTERCFSFSGGVIGLTPLGGKAVKLELRENDKINYGKRKT